MSCGSVPNGQGTAEEEQTVMARCRPLRRADKSTCQRCHSSRSCFIVRSAVFCRACFESNLFSRFVRQLYPPLRPSPSSAKSTRNARSEKFALSRPPLQAGGALIAVSGGAGSMAMLDMLLVNGFVGKGDGRRADKTKGEKEVVWDQGTTVYVEFAGVTGMDDRMEGMREMAERNGLRFVGIRAEEVFDPSLPARLGAPAVRANGAVVDLSHPDLPLSALPSSSTSSPLAQLQSLLASLPSPSRPALLGNVLSYLLNLAAQCLPNISHLLLGETSTREAQRVISATALGRGWALPLELSPAHFLPTMSSDSADATHEGRESGTTTMQSDWARKVLRMKAMKDVTLKEAAILCHLRGIPTVNHRHWANGAGKDARGKGASSIEGLTEHFIAGLNVTHPSTVSTVNKTGDKLVFPGEIDETSSQRCPVCQMPAEPSAQAWKSRTALTALPNKTLPPAPTSDGSSPAAKRISLASTLCYACLSTFTRASIKKDATRADVALPSWVVDGVSRRMVGPEEMRSQIAGFLL